MSTSFKHDAFDYTKEIQRGAAFMDAYKPGWDIDTNESRLNLGDGNVCILGQAFSGHYKEGKAVLHATHPWYKRLFRTPRMMASRYGFELKYRHAGDNVKAYAYSRLTEQWIDFMHQRRNSVASEQLAAQPDRAVSR